MTQAQEVSVVHEAYAFVCMSCGHGWEQSYQIEHHVDAQQRPFVVYRTDGALVHSPLVEQTCPNCDGHKVRIIRAGKVAALRDASSSAGGRTLFDFRRWFARKPAA
ncbi:hypothetical protein AB0N09_39760 [Streptomyces erythrochromogenes]|uniref:hypothetical protein n=1 Tax=Streptomyces erythrochromogenes TaxID=285574 RepID=UPI003414C0FF